ncbi:MAG: helix-turn-helix domain-containing protein [Armatimonadetes bacterium]|nr:helix-turn-helix domain-containing protein [Armatimonadota bacterium]
MRETAPLTESARFVDRLQEQVLTPLPVEAAAPTVPADEPVEVEHLATSAPAPEPSARVPRHWELLLRLPSCEVAQNSYKIPFRETREDLISRLLDPPLSLEEAARLIGVCPTTVRRYTSRGLLRHYRTVGNQRRFRLSDVLEFLSEKGGNIVEDGRKTKGQRRRTEDE